MNPSTILEIALTFAVTFTLGHLATRALLRRRDSDRPPTIHSRRKLRALAEAIVRMREAATAGITQKIRRADDALAQHAGQDAIGAILHLVGRRAEWVLEHKVRVQTTRILQRNELTHAAVHERIVFEALQSLPRDVLEDLAAKRYPVWIGMQCQGHVYHLDADTAATEARRLLDTRGDDR